MHELTHLSLFSGIGGLDLAAERAGFKTVGQCEYADYPYGVLCKHWPDVPKWRDVRDVTGNEVAEKCGQEITLLSGGIPCQPHSLAGPRLADADDRELSGEFLRIVREVRPRWAMVENVPGLLSGNSSRVFGRILRELAEMGYDARWCVYSAFQAGLEHERKRVFIVANADRFRWNGLAENWERLLKNHASHIPEEGQSVKAPDVFEHAIRTLRDPNSRVLRNDDGVPEALDRLKCVGNAVSPEQAYPILAAIAEIERGTE